MYQVDIVQSSLIVFNVNAVELQSLYAPWKRSTGLEFRDGGDVDNTDLSFPSSKVE